MPVVLFKRTGGFAIAAMCAGLGGCSGGDSPPQEISAEVSRVQAFDDASVASLDHIAAPSTADGRTVLKPADIATAQADFDQAADALLQR